MTVTTGQVRCPIFQRTQLSVFDLETNPRREELLRVLMSYLVDTPTGRLLVQNRIVTQSQTGTLVTPPDRLSPGREM